eukprot:525077-Pelagomonas_calceolata.AAC.2
MSAGQATFAADRMRSAASMIGHLQHMPSHTYLNVSATLFSWIRKLALLLCFDVKSANTHELMRSCACAHTCTHTRTHTHARTRRLCLDLLLLQTGYWHKGVEVNEASLQADFALATRCAALLPNIPENLLNLWGATHPLSCTLDRCDCNSLRELLVCTNICQNCGAQRPAKTVFCPDYLLAPACLGCFHRCVEPYTPFHNAQVLIYSAMSGAEKEAAELWATRLAEFPEKFGPSYETDGKVCLVLQRDKVQHLHCLLMYIGQHADFEALSVDLVRLMSVFCSEPLVFHPIKAPFFTKNSRMIHTI